MNNSINPANQSMYDRIVGGILDTATNAGRYYRNTPNPGILDFIEQNNDGSLARPGDPVQMSQGNYKTLNAGNVVRPASVMPTDGNDPSLRFAQNDPEVVSDGSVIRDYQLNNNLAVQTQPALSDMSSPQAADPGILANTKPVTGNRRDQTPMSFKPQTIDNNEMLMRVGLAGLGANNKGATASLGAMGDMYGAIQDTNRSGINQYNLAMQKAQAKAKGTGTGKNNSAKGLVVNDDIDRAFELVQEDKNGFLSNLFSGDLPATGWGTLLSAFPGSDANLLKNRLMTIKANISFDKLQAMREESPTGGALGQVSTFELQNLMAVFGSLEQSQDANELSYNLRRVQKVYNDVIHGEGNHPYQMPGSNLNAPAAAGNLSAADAIVGIN
jgi:hypothetical protein